MPRFYTGAGSIYADPAFQMGMALGNAYGNLWASNAKGRQKEKLQGIIDEATGAGGNEIAEIAAMGGNNGNGIASNTVAPGVATEQQTDLKQRLTNEVMGATPQQMAASVVGNIPGTDEALNYIQRNDGLGGIARAGNIDLRNRPQHKNADGSISTVRSISINEDGKEILIPTIRPDGTPMSDREAIDYYHQTGQNLGVFDSVEAANRAAEAIHNSEAARISTQSPSLLPLDDIINRAKAAGINQEVIDERLPELQKEAARRARETLLPGIAENLYGYTDANGAYVPPTASDYSQAIMDIARLREYDPETAKTLMGGVVSPADIYNNQQQERERMLGDESYMRRLQMQDAVKAQAEEREFNRTVDMLAKYGGVSRDDAARYILYGGNNSRRSNNGTYNIGKNSNGSRQSLINSPEFKYASEQLAALDEITASGEQLTPEQEALRRRLQPYVNSVINSIYQLTPETYNGSTDNDEVQYNGPVLNDYSYSMRDWTKALERNANAGNERWSRQKMINYARQKYGDNADAILRDTNWEAFGF